MRRIRNMVRGFTLIELLIVLAVIAALLAIVTPIALNAVAQAKATQVASNLRNIKSAVESYVMISRSASGLDPAANLTNSHVLVSQGYLTKTAGLADYKVHATVATPTINATITYTGGVDINKLINILPEATGTNTNVTYSFSIPIWW
ncbi:type II secretion system protein [Pseudothermotoga sp.]